MTAATAGNVAEIRSLLARGANVHATDELRWTALHWASKKGHSAAIEALLSGGTDIHAKDKNRRTALHYAGRHAAAVEALIAGGADIQARDKMGWTALHCAGKNGSVAVVETLLAGGADIHAKTRFQSTALHCAGHSGHAAVIEVLLARGVDLRVKDKDGNTALHYASSKGSLDAVKALLAAGANTNTRNNHDKTPRDLAMQEKERAAVQLLDNAKPATPACPLGFPAAEAEKEKESGPHTPGGATAAGGKHDAAGLPEAESGDGLPPAPHLASNPAFSGANTSQKSSAAKNRHLLPPTNCQLSNAVCNGIVAEVRTLLDRGAIHANETIRKGKTALHWAGIYGHAAVIETLLACGADIHARCKGGRTALHWASANGHAAAIEALLAGGADVRAIGKDGYTALHCASSKGSVDAVKALLAAGADKNARNKHEKTPRDVATKKKKLAVVKLLDDTKQATSVHPTRFPEAAAQTEEENYPPIPDGAMAEGAEDNGTDLQAVQSDVPRSSEELEKEATVAGQDTFEGGKGEGLKAAVGEAEKGTIRPDITATKAARGSQRRPVEGYITAEDANEVGQDEMAVLALLSSGPGAHASGKDEVDTDTVSNQRAEDEAAANARQERESGTASAAAVAVPFSAVAVHDQITNLYKRRKLAAEAGRKVSVERCDRMIDRLEMEDEERTNKRCMAYRENKKEAKQRPVESKKQASPVNAAGKLDTKVRSSRRKPLSLASSTGSSCLKAPSILHHKSALQTAATMAALAATPRDADKRKTGGKALHIPASPCKSLQNTVSVQLHADNGKVTFHKNDGAGGGSGPLFGISSTSKEQQSITTQQNKLMPIILSKKKGGIKDSCRGNV